jgi:hypothetical protein
VVSFPDTRRGTLHAGERTPTERLTDRLAGDAERKFHAGPAVGDN